MSLPTTKCEHCGQRVPKLVEQTNVEVYNSADRHTGIGGRLSEVTFIPPHNFVVSGHAYPCPGGRAILHVAYPGEPPTPSLLKRIGARIAAPFRRKET